jgi:hypothetical protein
MAIAPGYTALICPACTESQLWLGDDGGWNAAAAAMSCQTKAAYTLCHQRWARCRQAPRTAADANGGIAKAFFPTEAARAGHYRDLDIILGQLMGRKELRRGAGTRRLGRGLDLGSRP